MKVFSVRKPLPVGAYLPHRNNGSMVRVGDALTLSMLDVERLYCLLDVVRAGRRATVGRITISTEALAKLVASGCLA